MKKTHSLKVLALVQIVLVAACGTDSPQRILAPTSVFDARSSSANGGDDAGKARFSAWSAPVNVGPPVNTAFAEQTPAISKDGLSLYFTCLSCPGGYGGNDIWVAERATIDEPWSAPQHLGPEINTTANDGSPALSKDGRSLFFDSDRPEGSGGFDLYVAQRRHKHDNGDWQGAVNLGPGINTTANEQGAEYLAGVKEDDESATATLYFGSNRVGGPGLSDIYMIALHPDGTFGAPMLAEGLNSSFRDSGPAIRRDGLEIFFVSERPGGVSAVDIWVSTRASISDPWSTPVNLGEPINGTGNDAGPALSFDGKSLYFHSSRPGNVGGLQFFDLLVATREKLKGHD
jgi:Tol biopolymer transport system component